MLATIALALLGASTVLAQPIINTPTLLVYCQPSLIQWSGGTPGYYITVNQGGSQSNVLETLLSNTDQTQYTWTVDIAAGTSVTLAVRDSRGDLNAAAQVVVQPNPQGLTTCAAASSAAQSSAGAAASSLTSSLSSGSTVVQSSTSIASASALSSLSSVASSFSVASSSSVAASSSARSSSAATSSPSSSRALSNSVASAASSAAAAVSSVVSGAGVAKSASLATFGLVAVGAVALLV